MSREYLFRGQRIDTKEWVEGFLVRTNESTYICYDDLFNDDLFFNVEGVMIEVIPESVGQYTGLKDKNGKRIFEGDIFVSMQGWKCVVKWLKDTARFLGFTIEGERRIVYVDQVTSKDKPAVTVIGNIWEDGDDK